MVLGPTALSHVKQIQEIFFLQSSMNYYEVVSFFCRIFITFLFGLEMNIEYIWLNRRLVSLVAGGGAGVAAISALGVSFYLFKQLTSNASLPYFCIIIMLIVSYTSSPLVIRLASEMRLVSSNIGRIAVSSAIITEMACLMCFNLLLSWHSKNFLRGFGCFIITGAVILINRYLALWLNKRHVNQKYLKAPQLLLILFLLVGKSMIIEIWGYNSIISCFLVGLMFPREGKAARTLLHKLGYSIYNFVLPVYFGYLGFQCNLIGLKNLHDVINVAILIFMGICAKLSGTLLACRYLEIPLSEGIFLGFMLNTRGYADLLFFGAASKEIIVSLCVSTSSTSFTVQAKCQLLILIHSFFVSFF